ncbi:MAG: FxLYD domain-containing protein [Deltaproteobacteria bacterium]|jgi:hypothetical protein|nr:FxLYD domain-containing protein [Deltaproteobacteria bacterium]
MKRHPLLRLFPRLAVLAALALTLAGCPQMISVPGARQAPTNVDIPETGPGSLPVDVMEYSWEYLNGNTHVKISGTVANSSPGPIQGVNLYATLYDQGGTAIAYGETYVAPTYLAPGARGTFEFVALIKKPSGVTATRLVTVARPLSGF